MGYQITTSMIHPMLLLRPCSCDLDKITRASPCKSIFLPQDALDEWEPWETTVCVCVVRTFWWSFSTASYPPLMFTALFFPLVSHSRHVSGGDGVCYWIPFFLFPPPVCFPLTVQNVTHKAFFLSFPNVLNLGNFSPIAGSRRFSWQSVVPWSLRCDSQFLFFCDQRVWSNLHIA